MARRRNQQRKKKFKRKQIEIPKYSSGEETLANPCHICGGTVIYTGNEIIFNEPKGLGVCYYCIDCKAAVMCKKKVEHLKTGSVVHAPLGILADKETRQLRIRCHQLLDDKWKYRQTMKQSTAYRKLAKGMGIPYESCHFGWMNNEQLSYALEVMTLTDWTKVNFD